MKYDMDGGSLDMRTYWVDLLGWWWVFFLGAAVSAVAALLYSMTITPIYEAKTKVLVQSGQVSGPPTVGDIQASERLATNYSDLLTNRPILDLVINELSLPYGAATLFDKISVRSPRSLIEITVKDPDPQLAAELADTIAEIFIDDFQTRQLTQIAQFQSSLNAFGISVDPMLIAAQTGTLSMLIVVEEAYPPSYPTSPNVALNVIVAGVLGLLTAGLLVYGFEHMDDSIRTGEDLRSIVGVGASGSGFSGLTELGVIEDQRVKSGKLPTLLSEQDGHDRGLSDSYIYVMLNLEFAGLEAGKVKTMLITSALPSEGKTTSAVNLAISMSRAGKSVILVDADLRRPSLHRVFGRDNSVGLTSVIAGGVTIDDALAPTEFAGLKVILSGPVPPEPTLLLRSSKMDELIDALTNLCDILIFDSPPVLLASDPIVMASKLDAVVIIVDSQRTRRGTLQKATQSLYQANPTLLGAVLNKSKRQRSYGYYYYEQTKGLESDRVGLIGRLSTIFARRSARNHNGGREGRRRWNPARLLRRNAKDE